MAFVTIICKRCKQAARRETRSHSGFCEACSDAHRLEGRAAVCAVATAKRHGHLLPASTHTCVDCGTAAHDYDHRDYLRPLDVQPVCRPCNHRRGPAFDSVYRPQA